MGGTETEKSRGQTTRSSEVCCLRGGDREPEKGAEVLFREVQRQKIQGRKTNKKRGVTYGFKREPYNTLGFTFLRFAQV